MKRKRKDRRQRELVFPTWGGKRKRAGRKPRPGKRPGVSHHGRPAFKASNPKHVTCKLVPGLPSPRQRDFYLEVEGAIRKGNDRFGFRVVQFDVQDDHLHFVTESDTKEALSRGMQGLAIRIARTINRYLGRKG